MNRRYVLFAILLVLPALYRSSGCDINTPDIDRARQSLEMAIDKLINESGEWQVILPQLADELSRSFETQVQSALKDIENLLDEASGNIWGMANCFVERTVNLVVARELEQILGELTGQPSRRPLSQMPVVCAVSDSQIELNKLPSDIIVSGFEMYEPGLHLLFVKEDGFQLQNDECLSRQSNFQLTILMDSNIYTILKKFRWVKLTYGNAVLSELRIKL